MFPPKKVQKKTLKWVNAVDSKGIDPTRNNKICNERVHRKGFEQNVGTSYMLKLKSNVISAIFPNCVDIVRKAKMQRTNDTSP